MSHPLELYKENFFRDTTIFTDTSVVCVLFQGTAPLLPRQNTISANGISLAISMQEKVSHSFD